MVTAQPLAVFFRSVFARKRVSKALVTFAFASSTLLAFNSRVWAQGNVALLPVATDQTISGSLSNQFGVPFSQAVNQRGDLVFVGRGNSALFFRGAGTGTSVSRLLQVGDQIPGVAGSQIVSFPAAASINNSGKIAFAVSYSLSDALPHQAVLTYDGSTYHKIISSEDTASVSEGKFGTSVQPLATSAINDKGDVAFTAVPTISSALTLYIAPSGGTPLRIVAAFDPLPPPSTRAFVSITPLSGLNALGQVLFTSQTTSGFGLFLASETSGGHVQKIVTSGDAICGGGGTITVLTTSPTGVLSNNGTYVFTEQVNPLPTICVGANGGVLGKLAGAGTPAPSAIGGTLNPLPNSPLAIDSSGDIVFTSGISGSSVTGAALLRFDEASSQLDVVAYSGQAAPGTALGTFTGTFPEYSVAGKGVVAFVASLSGNATGLYQQTGTATPVAVAVSGQTTSLGGGGTIAVPSGDQMLDNGSLFFASTVTGGSANYALFLNTSGSLQPLMSTADTLPPNSNVSLLYGSPQAEGDFVGFGAQRAGGRVSLFVSNTASLTTAKVVTDGDPLVATGGSILGPNSNYFLNDSGQIVFYANLAGGTSPSAIILSSSTGSLSKVAAVGDSTPIAGTTFAALTLNALAPSPINSSGQVAFGGSFIGTSLGAGVFLSNAGSGGSVAKVAATGDQVVTSAGTGTLSLIGTSSSNIYAINRSGTVAFPGTILGNRSGFFVGFGGTVQKVATILDTTSIGPISTIAYLSGFSDSGVVTFTGAMSSGTGVIGGGWSVFTAAAGGPVTVQAYSGEAAPSGGTLLLATSALAGTTVVTSASNNALENGEGDVAIRAYTIGSGSGIFPVDATGSQAGVLRTGIYQGESVPNGGGSTLGVIAPATNFAFGPTGQIATVSTFGANSNPTSGGMFVMRHNGTLARVLAAGDSVLGGGVLSGIRLAQGLAAGTTGKFAFWAGISNGTAGQAIFSTIPAALVTLTSSPNPSVVGLTVTFAAVVTSISENVPTGSVTFLDNGSPIGTQQLNGAGAATFSTNALGVGSHSITAQYNGDSHFSPANSAVLTGVVLASGATPVITSASSATFSVGASAFFLVTATGVPTPVLSETGALPAGMNFNPATGILSGTPGAEASGTYHVSFAAKNQLLPDASQNFTITVNAVSATWVGSAFTMGRTRDSHTATVLENGKVLLAGGNPNGVAPTAEVYDPVTGTFTATGSMVSTRSMHTATLLTNGKVLITGGNNGSKDLTTAELYDPSTGTLAATGSMAIARSGHTASLLANGTVLIVGGSNNSFGSAIAPAEIYDPVSGTFTTTGSLSVARFFHAAIRLNNGKVLVVGGARDSSTYPVATELYDPATGIFTPGGNLNTTRFHHTATLMNNNKILVTGGFNGTSGPLSSPEVFDVATGVSTSITGMASVDYLHTATLLNNGTVMIVGGFDGTNSSTTVQIYDPVSGTFSTTGNLGTARASNSTTLLPNGIIFVAGGDNFVNHNGLPLATAELYQPVTLTPPQLASISVTPQSPLIPRAAAQAFIATGTFSDNSMQQLSSVTWGSSNPSVATISNDSSNQGIAYTLAQSGTTTISACAGSVCGTSTLTITAAPNFTSASQATFTVGAFGSFTLTAAGAPTPTFSVIGTLPSGVTLDPATGVLSGTPAAGTSGIYTFTLEAQNGVLPNGLQNFTLTLNGPPRITSVSNAAFTPGLAGSFTVTASGFPIPSISENGALPAGLSFNASTHVLSGTPISTVGGTYIITFTAKNGFLPDAVQTFTLTIQQSPAIVSLPVVGFTLGVPGSFTFTGTGIPLPTFSLTGTLPDGITFNPLTSTLSGTPTATTSGDYPLIVTAQNGVLPDATQNFVLSISRWTSTGSMTTPRASHLATLLTNGKVLITGGSSTENNNFEVLGTAELYDPSTGTFTATGTMAAAREFHTATLLNNGKVLITGGVGNLVWNSAELYDPSTGTFTATGNMASPRYAHAATLLNDGRVLITGGRPVTGDTFLASAEIYDPATGAFAAIANMTISRGEHTATLLNNGKVLIAGGYSGSIYLTSSEIFDPATSTFTATGSMAIPRAGQDAILLNDGSVLMSGGFSLTSSSASASELYDPTTGIFSNTDMLLPGRSGHTLTLLGNGNVLAAGGNNDGGRSPFVISNAQLYSEENKKFAVTDTMLSAREFATGTLLNNGKVLVAGGFDGIFPTYLQIGTAELYPSTNSAPQGLVSITVTPPNVSISTGSSVKFIATGTFTGNSTQQLASVSWSSSNDAAVTVTNDSTNYGAAYAVMRGTSATIRACAGTICGSTTLQVDPNTPPSITSANSSTFNVGSAGSFTVSATGFPPPVLTEAGPLPDGVTFNATTGVLSGTAGLGSGGTYPITFAAQNGVGTNAIQNFTLTVNEAPAITSAPITAFTVGSAGAFTLTATGSPAPSLSETGTLPNGLTFNASTGVLSGTPASGTGGTYPITFAAQNGVGTNAIQNFTLTVNQTPAITSAASAMFTVGSAGSFTLTATGSPAPSLSETGPLPSGVTFNASSGLLSGTPAAGTNGTYNLTFTAQNGIGSNAVENFTLTVVALPTITSFTAASNMIVLGNSTTLAPVFNNGTGAINNGIGAVTSGVAVTVTPTSTTTYVLTVTGSGGTSVTASTQIAVNNPVPTIALLAPAHANAGAAIAALTVNGQNFVSGAVVNFGGKAENTTFVSAAQLTALIPAADNAVGGNVQVTVTNPSPGGGTSQAQAFTADSFTESVPTNTMNVPAGQPAQFAITISPAANGFSNMVTLAASGNPPGSTVTFDQNPIAAGSTVHMTVTTTARSSLLLRPNSTFQQLKLPHMLFLVLVLISIFALISVCGIDRRRSVRLIPAGALLLCLSVALGCASGNNGTSGGGSVGTPAGTYTITVTASSGTLVQTTKVTLNVN